MRGLQYLLTLFESKLCDIITKKLERDYDFIFNLLLEEETTKKQREEFYALKCTYEKYKPRFLYRLLPAGVQGVHQKTMERVRFFLNDENRIQYRDQIIYVDDLHTLREMRINQRYSA